MLDSWAEFIRWFLFCIPIIFSPGPANIAVARISASHGFVSSIKFQLGLLFIVIIYGIVSGLGAQVLISNYPNVFTSIQYLGAFYVFYLAYKFSRMGKPEDSKSSKSLSFWDGIFVQSLNTKLITFDAVMYSQFLGDRPGFGELISVVVGQTILGFLCYALWGG